MGLLSYFNGDWLWLCLSAQTRRKIWYSVKNSSGLHLKATQIYQVKVSLTLVRCPEAPNGDVKDKSGGLSKIPLSLWQKWHPMKVDHQILLHWRRRIRTWGPFVGLDTKPRCWSLAESRVHLSQLQLFPGVWQMLTKPPPQAGYSHFCLTSRKEIGINRLEGTNLLESMPSARQQRMSQVAKISMFLWVWEKIILPLLGSKTRYTTAPPYPQTQTSQIKTKVVFFLFKDTGKEWEAVRGAQWKIFLYNLLKFRGKMYCCPHQNTLSSTSCQ